MTLRADRSAMPHSDVEDRLLLALARSLTAVDPATPELRAAVADYVAAAKSRLLPPQEVIATLKAYVHREALAHLFPADFDALVRRTVGWAIDDYYR